MLQVSSITTVEDIINNNEFYIGEYEGYIYMTTFLDVNKCYIGKKNFFHNTNVKLGKKELANLPITRGKKPTKKLVTKESDWKTYYGSSQEVKDLLKVTPKDRIIRSVLRICKNKKELTYYECKYLFQYGVLEPENVHYINDNILGKFYSKDLI